MKTKFKVLLVTLLAAVTAFAFTACNGGGGGGRAGYQDQPIPVNLTNLPAGNPIYFTSIGRGDIDVARITLINAITAANFRDNVDLTAADVTGNVTVVAVIAASSKGMGAAGVNAAGEVARVQALGAAENITLVVLHVGRNTSRGALSDPMITAAMAGAAVAIVWNPAAQGADHDEFFSRAAYTYNTPLFMYSTSAALNAPLRAVLLGT